MQSMRRHRLKVIEDAAQALGTEYKNRCARDSIGGRWVPFVSSQQGIWGGRRCGLGTTNDAEACRKLAGLRVHGAKPSIFMQWSAAPPPRRIAGRRAEEIEIPRRWRKGRQSNAAYYDAAFLPDAGWGKTAHDGGRSVLSQHFNQSS